MAELSEEKKETSKLRKSDATRARIVEAARERFRKEGFERTTIRKVAGDAGIDPSMVMRYFESKRGLFDAAMTVELRIPDLSRHPRDKLGEAIITHFLKRWEEPDADSLQLLLRSSASNEEAAERLRGVFRDQIVALVGRLRGSEADAREVASLIATQTVGLAYTRYVLKLPPLVAMPHETIIKVIGATIQRYLTEPLPKAGGQDPSR
ncbi:TetR family transcriptional regulator [Aestuariivirga sp. YIM B02566]|uniref:TetR family transcriptional regulator n=1 Tax=Taklimakanibacter albus TaxID=2800327 RepID=A0ACC5RB71_9HYPH|nr:TetR family transcriptional regulator [Aestuariivirga sp. YIM B02566]MBK1869892.1 TetR family transcriptional regulator [Aestuariivirga sp. YIM B02566]